MNNLRLFFITATMVILSINANAQITNDTTFVSFNNIRFHTNDTITLGYPFVGGDFSYIEATSKNRFSLLKKLAAPVAGAGMAIVGLGAANGSLSAVRTGANVASTANLASNVGSGVEVVNAVNKKPNKLTGLKLIIKSFDYSKAKDEGQFFFATAYDPITNKTYRINLNPAITTKEITAVNSLKFN